MQQRLEEEQAKRAETLGVSDRGLVPQARGVDAELLAQRADEYLLLPVEGVTALRRARMAPNTRLLASVIKDGVDTNAKLDAAEVARVRALMCWDCGGCGRS